MPRRAQRKRFLYRTEDRTFECLSEKLFVQQSACDRIIGKELHELTETIGTHVGTAMMDVEQGNIVLSIVQPPK